MTFKLPLYDTVYAPATTEPPRRSLWLTVEQGGLGKSGDEWYVYTQHLLHGPAQAGQHEA